MTTEPENDGSGLLVLFLLVLHTLTCAGFIVQAIVCPYPDGRWFYVAIAATFGLSAAFWASLVVAAWMARGGEE